MLFKKDFGGTQQEQGKIVFTSNSLELHQQHEKHNCKEKGLQNQGLEKQG